MDPVITRRPGPPEIPPEYKELLNGSEPEAFRTKGKEITTNASRDMMRVWNNANRELEKAARAHGLPGKYVVRATSNGKGVLELVVCREDTTLKL
jgi:hypothetical protein